MEKIRSYILDMFFLLGGRLALILVFLVAGTLFLTQSSEPAFSQTDQSSSLISKNGLTFDESALRAIALAFPAPVLPAPTATPTPLPTVIPIPTFAVILTPLPTAVPMPTVDPTDNTIWDRIAACESDGNWSANTGNSYFGGLQFSQGAWESVGGSGNPAIASREDQIVKAKQLEAQRGWGVWGACAKSLGLH